MVTETENTNLNKITITDIENHITKEIPINSSINNLNPHKDEIPNACGVYAFTIENSKVFGSSTNIRKRINDHIKGRTHLKGKEINSVDIYLTSDEICARLLEILLNKTVSHKTTSGIDIQYNLNPSLNKYEDLGYNFEYLRKVVNTVLKINNEVI